LGFKRQLKNMIHHCELCGVYFSDYVKKIVYRVDKNDKFKQCNTIVICERCQHTTLEDIKIKKENIDNYHRYLQVKGKVYRTRKKYKDE